MSNQLTKATSALSAKAHNVLFGLQGLVFAAAALHGDLASILTQIQSWIPMFVGIAHLIYHEKAVLSAAFSAGKSANITQVASQAAVVLSAASPDATALKNALSAIVTAVQAA